MATDSSQFPTPLETEPPLYLIIAYADVKNCCLDYETSRPPSNGPSILSFPESNGSTYSSTGTIFLSSAAHWTTTADIYTTPSVLSNVVSRFVPILERIAAPITEDTKQGEHGTFSAYTADDDEAFQMLQQKLKEPFVLALPKLYCRYVLDTSACYNKFETGLIQCYPDNGSTIASISAVV